MSCLNNPYGGELSALLQQPSRRTHLEASSSAWPSWHLLPRQLGDLELLLNGGYSPLKGFMSRADYESVCSSMRLTNGLLWPIPISLEVTEEIARSIGPRKILALRDPEGVLLSILHVEDVWLPPTGIISNSSVETRDTAESSQENAPKSPKRWRVGGQLEGIQLPIHYDFRPLRFSPAELRARFESLGWCRVVGYQTCDPIHRADYEMTRRAAATLRANLLIHPSVNPVVQEDDEHYSRVRSYQAILPRYPEASAVLSLVPLPRPMTEAREILLHAIVRKNYGCSHFMVVNNEPGYESNNGGGGVSGEAGDEEMRR